MVSKAGTKEATGTGPSGSGVNLTDIVGFVWSGRSLVQISAALGVLLAMLYVAYSGFMHPSSTSYREAIALTASRAKVGFYPNGLAYSPTDIRSPAVLQSVFADLKLDEFGLSLLDLGSALTVVPFSPGEERVNLKYRQMLGDDKLPLADRRLLEEEYQKALSSARADGALLTLTFKDSQSVPGQISGKILDAVLSAWARIFVDELGVTDAPGVVDSKVLLDEKQTSELDYALAYQRVSSSYEKLQSRIDAFRDTPGTSGVTIGDGGRTLKDIEREVEAVGAQQIDRVLAPIANSGLSIDPAMTKLTLQSLASDASQQQFELERRMKLIDEIVDQSAKVSGQQTSAAPSGTTTLTQLSDATVAQLVDLALKNADRPFVRDLLTQKMELGGSLAEMTRKRDMLNLQLAAVSAFEASGTAGSTELAQRFEQALASVTSELNRLWTEVNQLAERVSYQQLNTEKSIYVKIPIIENVVRENVFENGTIWLKSLMIVLFCALAGFAVHLGRSALGIGPFAR